MGESGPSLGGDRSAGGELMMHSRGGQFRAASLTRVSRRAVQVAGGPKNPRFTQANHHLALWLLSLSRR